MNSLHNRPAVVALAAALITFAASKALAADNVPKTPAELEAQLLGSWRGGPCMGVIRFSQDGTFQRRHYSPGDSRIDGVWKVRWDALPPTLTLTCKSSDDPESFPVDKVWELKIVRLDAEKLGYAFSNEGKSEYRRLSVSEEAESLAEGLVVQATLTQVIGTFSSFGIPSVGDMFSLDLANLPSDKLAFVRPGAEGRTSNIPIHSKAAVVRVQQSQASGGSSRAVIEIATADTDSQLRIRLVSEGFEAGAKLRIVIYRAGGAGSFLGSMAEAEGVWK